MRISAIQNYTFNPKINNNSNQRKSPNVSFGETFETRPITPAGKIIIVSSIAGLLTGMFWPSPDNNDSGNQVSIKVDSTEAPINYHSKYYQDYEDEENNSHDRKSHETEIVEPDDTIYDDSTAVWGDSIFNDTIGNHIDKTATQDSGNASFTPHAKNAHNDSIFSK